MTATPLETLESSGYYPSLGGDASYDDLPTNQAPNNPPKGGEGKSEAFMGIGVGAQIGIIAAVVVVAIALFVGTIIYYFHRRKQWEKEVKRRSQLPPGAKLKVNKKGEVEMISPDSEMALAGGEKLGGSMTSTTVNAVVIGEKKPGVWNMLLGKF